MTRLTVTALCLLTVCFRVTPTYAQEAGGAPPAHVSVVDGTAILERDGRSDTDLVSMPVLAGDRIRTQGGRVEVLFADGSALHLDSDTIVDFQSDEVVRLLAGRVRLSVGGPARDLSYRIDAPSAWVQISTPGEYRVGILRDDEVELAVLRGSAELVNEQGRSYISAGERTFARLGSAPSPAYVFNSAAWDSFDRWSEARRDQRLGISAQYLPADVRPYAPAFDAYGSWRYEQAYGYVWYPRVQVGWRPYHHGRWASLRPYGWTWIAGDPWGWPTHHYGRWGISAGAWFWIPGASWAPAWVSWAYAPGYVSWCPLGWNNHAVFAFNVNFHGGHRYSPWDGWTVLPRHHFNAGYINVSRIPTVHVDPRLHSQFVVGPRAPEPHFAVNRASVPIHSVGRSGPYRTDAGTGFRSSMSSPAVVTGGGGGQVDRGFPAGARAPGTPIGSPSGRAGVRARDGAATTAPRSTTDARQPSATAPIISAPETTGRTAGEARSPAAPGYRSEYGNPRARRDAPSNAPVTAPPAGAVRAVPRTRSGDVIDIPSARGADRQGTTDRQDRVRSWPGVPSYQTPIPAAPSYSPLGGSRTSPSGRQSGAPGVQDPGGYGGTIRNRVEIPNGYPGSGGGQPAYRPGPERQAPSGAADRAPRGNEGSRPERANGAAGGGARERSSESRSTGQATGRRR